MLIGIVSDTHGSQPRVEKAVSLLRQREVACVLHCGDIDDVATVHLFRDLPTHFVFGNNDTDRTELRHAIQQIGATVQEPFGNLELAGIPIAWVHGDDVGLLRDLERSGHFRYVFYGHSHRAERHQLGSTTVINPGALFRATVKTFIVLDPVTGIVEDVVID